MVEGGNRSQLTGMIASRANNIELLYQSDIAEDIQNKKPLDLKPSADKVDFINKGSIIVKVMDEHNFYEADHMGDEYLKDAPICLLTKIWISISRSLKE